MRRLSTALLLLWLGGTLLLGCGNDSPISHSEDPTPVAPAPVAPAEPAGQGPVQPASMATVPPDEEGTSTEQHHDEHAEHQQHADHDPAQ